MAEIKVTDEMLDAAIEYFNDNWADWPGRHSIREFFTGVFHVMDAARSIAPKQTELVVGRVVYQRQGGRKMSNENMWQTYKLRAEVAEDELQRLRAEVARLSISLIECGQLARKSTEELITAEAENAALQASALKQHNEAIEMAAKVCEKERDLWVFDPDTRGALDNATESIRALLRPEPATPSSPERT